MAGRKNQWDADEFRLFIITAFITGIRPSLRL